MAYFCDKTGARVCAPGVALSAGGAVPDHAGADVHREAEAAAASVLAAHLGPPGPEAFARALDAAVKALGGPERDVLRPMKLELPGPEAFARALDAAVKALGGPERDVLRPMKLELPPEADEAEPPSSRPAPPGHVPARPKKKPTAPPS